MSGGLWMREKRALRTALFTDNSAELKVRRFVTCKAGLNHVDQ
jgi:hypothetical protein